VIEDCGAEDPDDDHAEDAEDEGEDAEVEEEGDEGPGDKLDFMFF